MTQREMIKAFPIPALPGFFCHLAEPDQLANQTTQALRRFGASPLLPDGAGQGEERLGAR